MNVAGIIEAVLVAVAVGAAPVAAAEAVVVAEIVVVITSLLEARLSQLPCRSRGGLRKYYICESP